MLRAHEINNPIGTVNSSADVSGRCIDRIELLLEKGELLQEIRDNPQLPQVMNVLKDNVRVTTVAGNRIASIVKSLKNFARLDEAEYQRVDIHEGIDSSLTLMGSELRSRISVAREYGEIPAITCYPGRLNQVFINLLKNASQAIEGSGSIGIKTFVEDNRIYVEISDTGKGIPPERLDTIFDFGFSVAGERVKMGSGLSTAYNIVQEHDGEIEAKSEVGKGTTFSIVLPIN